MRENIVCEVDPLRPAVVPHFYAAAASKSSGVRRSKLGGMDEKKPPRDGSGFFDVA